MIVVFNETREELFRIFIEESEVSQENSGWGTALSSDGH